jgi:class 3 adenylate cyclase/FixJ family two-component response regulator
MKTVVRILIVDDSRPLREFIVQALASRGGFDIMEASNGAEGLESALASSPDLMLLDMEMPRLNGLQVLDSLCAHGIDLPVILMTGHGSEAIAVEVFRKGVKDYLIKPFAAEEMFSAIDRALSEVRLRREKEALTRHLAVANQQLRRRVRELDALYRVGKSVTSLLSRDLLLQRILEAVFYVVDVEEATLMLLDKESGHLRKELYRQRVPGRPRQLARRSAEELAVEAIRKGDATSSGAMLCVPLKVGDRVIGVLGVSNRVSARPLSQHDRLLLLALADYAAIALENARLLQTVEETKEREKQIVRGLFERYVSPAVVERLLARPEKVALGGTRQLVAVLFADIRGFSTYSAHTDPETLVDVLNRHLAVAAEAVLAEEGTLDKFMGDAVMAFFNAPLPQPDFALRAVRAALRLHYAVARAQRDLPPEHRLRFGVGISVGEAVVGNIGTARMMSFTVVGDAVNLGRRLQEHARGGQTLLSQWAYQMVRGHVEARPVGGLEIKGRDRPEPAFELLGLRR